MGFDEGRIILNSENGTYFAGQTVHAKLVFQQDKVKTFRGIYAKMKGFCEVHWTSQHSRRVPDGQGGHRTEHYTETHESHEVYVERKVYLVGGESGDHRLNTGKHEFPFDFPLPANCPSSFEGTYGHIRYEVKVVVDRAFKTDQEKKIRLTVIAPLDLNADPYCDEPIEIELDDNFSCCCMGRGSCETLVKLPKGGYCPGQTVPIEVSCENKSTVEIKTISLAIEQYTVFHASQHPGTKHERDTVAKLKKGPVPGNTSRTWTVDVAVPGMDLYNVAACRYIDIDYSFVVKVSPEGCHDDSKTSRRFVIGTIPLRGYQDSVPNPMQDQMPKMLENYQNAAPHFGPVVSQPMPNVSPYPAPSPYPANSPYPGANPPYPGANSPHPGANPPYPGANSPHPGANSPYPGANPPYPGANPPYPGANPPYPGANPPYPTANPHYPAANSPYPAANSPYPAANSPYPAANSPYPGANPPYPGVTPPPPGGARPVSPYPPPYSAAPSLPPGANVPYPAGPTSPFVNASAPGLAPATPDSAGKKNPLHDHANNPPFNPNFKA